jgi:hypothetical protein
MKPIKSEICVISFEDVYTVYAYMSKFQIFLQKKSNAFTYIKKVFCS